MTNDDTYGKLNDYLDGLLSENERRAFEALLAEDAELRAEAEALRGLRAEAAALPREIVPHRDLWDGVASRIGAGGSILAFRRPRRHGRIALWSYVAAAAAILFLVLGTPTMLNREQHSVAPRNGVAIDLPVPPADDELRQVTAQYLDARQQLLALLEERKADIAPETFAVVEENLSVIAAAVNEIEVALAVDPQSRALERMLFAAYQSEVDLLQQAVTLADRDAVFAVPADGTEGEINGA